MLKLTHPVVDIAVICSHFEESLHFYHEVLGLEIAADLNIPEHLATGLGLAPRGFRQVRVRAGKTLIKLIEIDSPPPRGSHDFTSGVRWLTFYIEDLKKTVEELKANGVKFAAEPLDGPDAPGIACALDPDGILIELLQRKA